jgi:hypothetical protein
MLNFCSIVVAILKMETGRNFSIGTNILLMSLWWNIFWLIYTNVSITGVSKWAGTRYFYPSEIVYSTGRNYWTPILQCWIFAALWWPFWKWRPVEIFRCRESIQDIEIEWCWICVWYCGGTFTRLRSCIVPAEITEPPPKN